MKINKDKLLRRYNHLKSDGLIKNATALFIMTMAANFCDYFYQVFISRRLGPSQYGVFVSLTGLLSIVGVPGGTLQTVITKFVANFKALNQMERVTFLFFRSIRKLSFMGLVILIIFLFTSGHISSFLQISSKVPVIIVGIILAFSLIMPIIWGTLQGLQKFNHLGLNLLLGSFSRLILGIFLVYLGFGASGALGALVLAWGVALFAASVPLKFIVFQKQQVNNEINLGEVYRYFIPVSVALLCLTALRNMDVIFVKHFFSPLDAGYYSAASVVGRIFFALPATIIGVMFPKVSELHAQGKDTNALLKKCMVLSLLLLCSGILVCFLFPRFIILTLFGSNYLSIEPLVKVFGIAITPLVLAGILTSYKLARKELKFLYLLIPGTILQIILLTLFHKSLLQVIFILGISGSLIFLFFQYLIQYDSKQGTLK